MKNKRENDKWLNTQPPAQGIKNMVAKVGLMMSAYNRKDSFVPIKGDIVICMQPLCSLPIVQVGPATFYEPL